MGVWPGANPLHYGGENIREIPHIIKINGLRLLNVIMEGRNPKCHHCGQILVCLDRQNKREEEENGTGAIAEGSKRLTEETADPGKW